jgi:hypothetical protein
MRLDNDTRQKGVEGPFEAWEGDHTALVHVLWAAKHDGLTLAKDFDEIASMILSSRFLAARVSQAIDADRAARAKVTSEAFDMAAQYEREAAEIRQRMETEDLASDDLNLLDHNATTLERLAAATRQGTLS